MTEASSFLPQTRSTTFLLILNKYIFTFLCYIHYVNNLKPMLQKNLTLYLLIVVRKEGLSFSTEWLLHKKKVTYALVVFGMFVFVSKDKLRVSAVNRVVEETIFIGMPIPRRKVKRRGGGINTVCVKSSKQINMRRLTLAESFQKNTFFHFVQLLSLWSSLHGPNSGTGVSDPCFHTVRNMIKFTGNPQFL